MADSGKKPAAPVQKRAPTFYAIIGIKLIKGALFVTLAIVAYTLSDNNLPVEFQKLLHWLRLSPEKKFFSTLAVKIGKLTEANLLWTAAGTLVYSLFSLVEGVGMIFRVTWCAWMAIGESAFFIPLEVYDLLEGFTMRVFVLFVINVVIVWYLLKNRQRLFKH